MAQQFTPICLPKKYKNTCQEKDLCSNIYGYWKETNSKQCTLFDFIYTNFKNRQN